MPLYEYKCISCEKISEVMQKFSDPPLEKCEACGGSVSKLMSLSSFSLKGSGWYTTDYKKAPSAPSQSGAASKDATNTPSNTSENPSTKPAIEVASSKENQAATPASTPSSVSAPSAQSQSKPASDSTK